MSDSNEGWDGLLDEARQAYHAPPETPREKIWTRITAEIDAPSSTDEGVGVVSLESARESRSRFRAPARYAAVAAALVIVGIGIGRMTAPPTPTAVVVPASTDPTAGLQLAAQEHLGRTESFLTMVRAEARDGSLAPETSEWARGLLSQTRLLLDQERADRTVDELLEDLEWVLIQIVQVGDVEAAPASREELDLVLRGMDDGEVLPRIQAAIPMTMEGA